jgi:hypothetical protein
MKIDWKFVGIFLGVGFALGFAKPSLPTQAFTVLTFVVYGSLWVVFRNNATKTASNYVPFFNFVGRIFVFYVVTKIFKDVIDVLPEYKEVLAFPYLAFLVFGAAYCFSSMFRMYVTVFFSRFIRNKRD